MVRGVVFGIKCQLCGGDVVKRVNDVVIHINDIDYYMIDNINLGDYINHRHEELFNNRTLFDNRMYQCVSCPFCWRVR